METDEGDAVQVATNRGWRDFREWVETLDACANPDLAEFTAEGHCDCLQGLAKQLCAALKTSPPQVEGVDVVANGILAFLRKHAGARTLTIE